MKKPNRLLARTANLRSAIDGDAAVAVEPGPEAPIAQASQEPEFPPVVPAPSGSVTVPTVRTGPGQMMLARKAQLENEQLRAKLAEYDGTLPVRKMDPGTIRRSALANRDESEFVTPEFMRLKSEIEAAGGNVQPIRVRPVAAAQGAVERYEIVFGHRRHRACMELGIPVLAMIEEANERELWIAMDRENRERKSLSPWEQGCSIKRALDAGLFPSIRRLAEEAGIDQSNATKFVQLARLPREVVDAFASPSDIQMLWAPKLVAALDRDPQGLLARAQAIANRDPDKRAPKAVLDELVGAAGQGPVNGIEIRKAGQVVATLKSKRGGKLHIEIAQTVDLGTAAAAIRELLGVQSEV